MNKHPKGSKENIKVAKSSGKAALIAKNYYGEVTGNKAVSNTNMLNYEYIGAVKNEVGSDKSARITRSRNSKGNLEKESIK